MKTTIFLLLTTLLCFSFTETNMCSCDWGGSFLSVSRQASLVALVRIDKYSSFKRIYGNKTPISMEVEVLEVLQGREQRRTIRVWGDDGNYCRPYLSDFQRGSTWIMALLPGNTRRGHPDEREEDYTTSICGEYWLPVKRGIVTGIIEGEFEYKRDSNGNFIRDEKRLSWGAFRRKFRDY